MFIIVDYSWDSVGLFYVYLVVLCWVGGVLIGINLNINNVCNWVCFYCQVDNLMWGGLLLIDLDCFECELVGFFEDVVYGDFM